MRARVSATVAWLALAGLGLLSGCVAPSERKAPSVRYVSARQRTANDQAFYRAVTAYVQGDYEEAGSLLRRILRTDPGNKDARSLRSRVEAAQRLSAR